MPALGAGAGQRDIPLAQIEDMQRKGLTNNQIIQTLQRDGFTTSQIFDALNQANMQPTHQMGNVMNPGPQGMAPLGAPQGGMPPPGGPGGMPPPGPPMGASNEELIEAIIDEKWNDLVKDVNKIVTWKDSMSAKIEKMEQRMDDMKAEFDKLHEAVIGKIGEYDKNILEVGAEVKAMEKVFSKSAPCLYRECC
jgi:hypothetical protein